MFSLNEGNRFVMAQHPSDMRMGVNAMCGQVSMVGLDPANGDVYVFVGKSRKVMKVLHWGARNKRDVGATPAVRRPVARKDWLGSTPRQSFPPDGPAPAAFPAEAHDCPGIEPGQSCRATGRRHRRRVSPLQRIGNVPRAAS